MDAAAFYDDLAAHYHLLFDDWWTAAEDHARVVDALLRRAGVGPPAAVLDATCGIGTQAIPLASIGYRMTGTDVSAGAIDRARREASSRGVPVTFDVCDIRDLPSSMSGGFDAVISFDNALAHLVEPGAVERALGAVRQTLTRGGAFLASLRDYDQLRVERPTGVPPLVRIRNDVRAIVGQAWEWDDDGEAVTIHLFVLRERSNGWTPHVFTTRSRALTRRELSDALAARGFADIEWFGSDDIGFYQPIVSARAD